MLWLLLKTFFTSLKLSFFSIYKYEPNQVLIGFYLCFLFLYSILLTSLKLASRYELFWLVMNYNIVFHVYLGTMTLTSLTNNIRLYAIENTSFSAISLFFCTHLSK